MKFTPVWKMHARVKALLLPLCLVLNNVKILVLQSYQYCLNVVILISKELQLVKYPLMTTIHILLKESKYVNLFFPDICLSFVFIINCHWVVLGGVCQLIMQRSLLPNTII